MKLVDITSSNHQLVQNQLNNTDATFIKVYTYGATTIIFTKAAKHIEILYRNKKRQIKKIEIDETLPILLKEQNIEHEDIASKISSIELDGYVELSIPC